MIKVTDQRLWKCSPLSWLLLLDDVISVAASVPQIHTDPFGKSTLRHSLRSLQYTKTDSMHHLQGNEVLSGRNSEDPVVSDSRMQRECIKCEDPLLSGIYGLSLNGYKAYIERYAIIVQIMNVDMKIFR